MNIYVTHFVKTSHVTSSHCSFRHYHLIFYVVRFFGFLESGHFILSVGGLTFWLGGLGYGLFWVLADCE